MTNAEKFEDVFGFEPQMTCIISTYICDGYQCVGEEEDEVRCPYENWWYEEYETPDRLPFE